MPAITSTAGPAVSALAATVSVLAAATSTILSPFSEMPPGAALDGAMGSSSRYAREDHTHAIRVQRTVVTTAADGTYKWTYARAIACPRGKLTPVAYMVDDTGTPVVVQVVSREFTTSADGLTDTHTAVTVKAQRSRTLPATISLVSILVNYDVFAGSVAAGVKVNLWAADPTQ